jgi:hypothetical protein
MSLDDSCALVLISSWAIGFQAWVAPYEQCPFLLRPTYQYRFLVDGGCANPRQNTSLAVNCTSMTGFVCADNFCQECVSFPFVQFACLNLSSLTPLVASMTIQCAASSLQSHLLALLTLTVATYLLAFVRFA